MPSWKKIIQSGSDAALNSLFITNAVTASQALLSSSQSDILQVVGSGSSLFNVVGSQGQLFGVTDSLSGSLMSVNDISGLPILEVFSDDRVVMGNFINPALIVTGSKVGMGGVTAPTYSLDVQGAVSASTYYGDGSNLTGITVGTSSIVAPGSTGELLYSSASVVQAAPNIVFSGSNIGIGTTTPPQKLTIEGNISASGAIFDVSGSSGSSGQMIQSTTGGFIWTDNIAEASQDLVVSGVNMEVTTIEKGTPLYFSASGASGNVVGVYVADAGNPNRMPAGGVAAQQLTSGSEGDVYLYGFINGVDTSTFNSGDSVFVAVGGGYTNVKPTGSALIQKLGNVEKSHASNGSGVIQGPSWYNDLPNWEQGKIKVGISDGQPITSSFIHLDESNQYLGVGTTSPSYSLDISGSGRFTTSVTASQMLISGSGADRLLVQGSGSTIFEVVGSVGSLFAVSDGLSGSLLQVANISGFPIFEVFSDDKIVMGNWSQSAAVITGSKVGIGGVSNPTYSLDVQGAVSASTYYGDGSNLTGIGSGSSIVAPGDTTQILYNSASVIQAVPNGKIAYYPESGKVQIGDLKPEYTGSSGFGAPYNTSIIGPTVFKTSNFDNLSITREGVSVNEGPAIQLNSRDLFIGSYDNSAQRVGWRFNHQNNTGAFTYHEFLLYDGSHYLLLDSAGRLGVGKDFFPSHSLDVSGSVRIQNSGSTVFEVRGDNGTLFSIEDSMTGSLFSVTDQSGLSVLDAWDNGEIYFGDPALNAMTTTGYKTSVPTSSNYTLHLVDTVLYDSVFVDYTVKSASLNIRAGQLMGCWDGAGNVEYTDVSTNDIGDTSQVTMSVDYSASYARVLSNVSTQEGWEVRTIIRTI